METNMDHQKEMHARERMAWAEISASKRRPNSFAFLVWHLRCPSLLLCQDIGLLTVQGLCGGSAHCLSHSSSVALSDLNIQQLGGGWTGDDLGH